MKYQIEQFKWHNKEYYHLVASKVFECKKPIKECTYYKNGSYFTISKVENEVQTNRRERG